MSQSRIEAVHGCLLSIVAQYDDKYDAINPEYYDVFDEDGNCLNEGNPFYIMPTEGQLELLAASHGLTKAIKLSDKEDVALLKANISFNTTTFFEPDMKFMKPPFATEALQILASIRALG